MDCVDARTAELIPWLIEHGLRSSGRQELLNTFCEKLVEQGVPLWRFHLGQRAYHPKFGGIGYNWTRSGGISHEHYERRQNPREAWLKSPFYQMLEHNIDVFQSDLTGPLLTRHPLLQELKDQGASEYLALALRFTEDDTVADPNAPPEGVLASWTSDRVGGFSDQDKALIQALYPVLGLALKSISNRQMASDLLQTYLGRDPGLRVLSGEFQRGSSNEIDAVIGLFDLKGFTSLAGELPGPALIEMLNDYFGIAVETTHAHGGNILKFLGDGVLGMFNLGTLEEDAKAALDASAELSRRISLRNEERAASGLPVADWTLALHAGRILYGNIGAENRLDFTVIGPAVNQTARIADMHRSVGQNLIFSQVVQRAASGGAHDMVSLGRYMLRGVSEPMELFTIYRPDGALPSLALHAND
ncbi:adenylate/guanylate cyclase domain-containing protein [Pseudophaeobacter flagellatus]|uniref:adenylate/guanylate cyclase domain-containing protein n=1 Tax=Pseudophaeobacter flagellatus TaxID=2899119 RepID=UPI001E36D6B7|nr:adenylate/guanylate cyclase domain-containing protein [Pseudophaeobacter flagellatus]MCD9149360.1 adenylate/guanylate cyclase domain-containing protein [Pseudophaeobacter flagellatus]